MIPRSRHQDRWTLLERWTPGFQRELNYWNRDDTEEEIKAQKPFQLMKENHSWGFLLHVFLGGTVPIPMVHWSRPNVWYVCYNSHVGETRDWSNDTPQREFHPPWLSPGVGRVCWVSRGISSQAQGEMGFPKPKWFDVVFLIHTVLSYYIMTKETMMIWGYNGREGSAYIFCLYSVDTVYLSPYESWDSQRIDSFVHGNNVGISLINWGGEETDPPVFWLSKWTYDQWAPLRYLKLACSQNNKGL